MHVNIIGYIRFFGLGSLHRQTSALTDGRLFYAQIRKITYG